LGCKSPQSAAATIFARVLFLSLKDSKYRAAKRALEEVSSGAMAAAAAACEQSGDHGRAMLGSRL